MSEEKIDKKYFEIRRIYIKDVSFEAPNTPNIFDIDWKPSMNFDLNNKSLKIDIDIFEVVLHVRVTVKHHNTLVFLCDVHQAGIFSIMNLNKNMLQHCLGAYCPNILFPYARSCISHLVSNASFPQLNLAPVNFDSIYYKKIEFENNNIKK